MTTPGRRRYRSQSQRVWGGQNSIRLLVRTQLNRAKATKTFYKAFALNEIHAEKTKRQKTCTRACGIATVDQHYASKSLTHFDTPWSAQASLLLHGKLRIALNAFLNARLEPTKVLNTHSGTTRTKRKFQSTRRAEGNLSPIEQTY